MLSEIDRALAHAIEGRNAEALAAIKDDIGAPFHDSLVGLFAREVDDPKPWGTLGDTLTDMELYKACEAAYGMQIHQTFFATEKAEIYAKLARIYVRLEQRDKAGKLFAIAARLDPSVTSAAQQAQALAPPFGIQLVEPWRFVPLYEEHAGSNYQRAYDKQFFPALYADMCRNEFAMRYHFNRLDPCFGERRDCSFVITHQSTPITRVECNIAGDESLMKCMEVPIKIFFNDSPRIDQEITFKGFQIAVLSLIKLIEHHDHVRYLWLEDDEAPVATPVSLFVGERSAQSEVQERCWIDLDAATESNFTHIRKGHKSNIKWGQKNLELIDWADSSDEQMIHDFYELHKVADRYPGYDNPAELRASLMDGSLGLSIAKLKGTPVAAVLVGYQGKSAYYMASASDHSIDAPLAHYPLFHAIQKSHERGIKIFELGYVHTSEDSTQSEKAHQISRFKRGFATDFQRCIMSVVPIGTQNK